ncbi:MAG: GNAT family N-acetyltransferase [Nitrososphaerales archaeon]
MPPNITVRRARKKDFPGFLELLVGLANFEHLDPPSSLARKRLGRDIFDKNKKLDLLLALAGDKKPVGYALYFFTYSSFLARPTLFLEDLFVDQNYRRRGIGRKLFLACAYEASRKKCGRMEWSVLTWNKSAIDFYEKAGARRLSEWHYYRLDSKAFENISRRD